jgi:2-keto-4-pentenoate hydratase/2-oxohepta-3-ene-1,7-dioic acid hydratase in catechol pathway
MPLRRNNTRHFYRVFYSGITETIQLLKRNNDQQEGIVTAYTIFACRRSKISKTGEPIQEEMAANHHCTWHIPRSELLRVGLNYINAADRIVNREYNLEYTWMPESDTRIDEKLFGNQVDIECHLFLEVPL